MLFQKTLIIGLGLIGGSFAKALRQNQISKEILACDLDSAAINLAKDEQVIDNSITLEDNLSDFDFIVLATPLSAYKEIFDKIFNRLSDKTIFIDLGSIKELKLKNLPKNFIPCHPIAGSENNGFEHSSADLFLDKKFIICAENSEENSLKKLTETIKKIGAKTEFLSAKKHDEIYALVSHLPQFLSFLTAEFSPKEIKDEFFKTTFRLDNSSPEIWDDIFKLNEKNLEKFYMQFFDELENVIENPQKIIEKNPTAKLPTFDEKFFEENFAAIFFRALIVSSYLKISQIKSFENYAGSGFRDFTSIISILNYDSQKLHDLIKKNQSKIFKIFDSIS